MIEKNKSLLNDDGKKFCDVWNIFIEVQLHKESLDWVNC